MTTLRLLFGALLLAALGGFCMADADTDLVKENAELKKRVTRLEQDLAELKRIVLSQARQPDRTDVSKAAAPAAAVERDRTKTPVAATLSKDQLEKIAAMVDKKGRRDTGPFSGFEIKPYGYIKWDASYDTSRIEPGNFAKWVRSEATNRDDNQFNMTANETRLGIRISSREKGTIQSSGLVEVDLFGNGAAQNKPAFQIRHAYMKLDWPEERFSIIAGQTWDVIGPLNPYTLNYSVQWWAGNIGFRRPQIRFTKSYYLNDVIDLKFEGALARTIGVGFDEDKFPNIPGDAGQDAGFPGVQGRISSTFPLFGGKLTSIGFSGHWAKEELDRTATGNPDHFDSWSLNMDLTQPINKWLTVQAELFTGENLSAYVGGIGQGINTERNREIGSRGGWVAARISPWDKWDFNVGVSIDDVDDSDLVGMAGDRREYNRAIFGNVIYSINKSTQLGFELSQWHTEYQDQPDADSIRAQTSLIYKF